VLLQSSTTEHSEELSTKRSMIRSLCDNFPISALF